MSMKLNDLIDESWQTAEDKGWHTLSTRSLAEELCLMHSELSECLEEIRNGKPESEIYYTGNGKPEGIAVELADVIIRIADTVKARGIPLEQAIREKLGYNRTRPVLHGGKRL